jgi:N-acetylmuramoyl-L-alanine amidase
LVPHPRRIAAPFVLACVVVVAVAGARQASHASLPFTVVSDEGRRPLAAVMVGEHVMVPLDDLAALFQLAVREDSMAGGLTITTRGKTIILTPGQALASAGGRIVSLPAPPSRDGRRWLVPVEFISRALGPVYESRLEVRKNARLVLIGNVRVPRVTVKQDALGPQTRVTVSVTPRTAYTISQEPGRILVRFDVDTLDAQIAAAPPLPVLQGIRLADPNGTIALDLGPRFGSFRASLAPQEDGSTQILVDLMAAPDGLPVPAPSRGGPAASPAPPAQEPSAQSQPAAGTLRTVVVDPGHGGDEPCAKGEKGTLEKDVVLAVARRLKGLMESRLGVRVLLTRDADQAVPIDERAALANSNKADLFVSLHANAAGRPDVSGAQIFYLAAAASDAAGAALSTRQTLPTVGGGSRDIEMIPWELAQLRCLGQSALLAGALEEQFRERVRLNPRAVQQGPFRVLAGANMPAVLVEIGFLTNPDEEQQLALDTYQATVAQAILDGLLRFRQLLDQAAVAPAVAVPATPGQADGARRRP